MLEDQSSNSQNKVILIAVAILIIAVGFWVQIKYGGFATYRDDANKVQFSYQKSWSVGSVRGFVKLIADPTKPNDLNVLVKIDPPQLSVDYLNLGDSGTKLTLGDKTLTIAHREEVVPGGVKQAKTTMTFTHLYWKDKNGRGYIFEISPWQKNGLNSDLSRVFESFKAL